MDTQPATPLPHSGAAMSGRQTMEPAMKLALDANFGSVEKWCDDIARMATTMDGGCGWAVLAFQPHEGTLVNRRAADDTAAGVAGVPILTLDLQAFASQIGMAATAADSAEALMADIDWAPPYQRYQQAVTAASEAFGATHDDVSSALLIDVRRAGVFTQAATTIPGAQWRDPAAVAIWAAELATDREVVVYCVYGHEVGRTTAMRLRAAGVKARYLRGGIDGWQAAGRRLEVKADADANANTGASASAPQAAGEDPEAALPGRPVAQNDADSARLFRPSRGGHA